MEQKISSILIFPSIYFSPGNEPDEEFTGAVIDGDKLIVRFSDAVMEAGIHSIRAIRFDSSLFSKGKNNYWFEMDENGDQRMFAVAGIFFERSTLKALILALLQVNPSIALDSATQSVVNREYVICEKLTFDFSVHKKNQVKEIIYENKSSSIANATLIVLSIMIALVVLVPLVGERFLVARFGENYGDLRIALLLVAGFLLSMAPLNFLLALLSRYRGHTLTFGLLFASVAAIVTAFL